MHSACTPGGAEATSGRAIQVGCFGYLSRVHTLLCFVFASSSLFQPHRYSKEERGNPTC